MQPTKTIKANKANISSPLVLLTDSFLIIFTLLLCHLLGKAQINFLLTLDKSNAQMKTLRSLLLIIKLYHKIQ